MERKGSRRQKEQSLQISFGDFNLTISSATQAPRLVPRGEQQTSVDRRVSAAPKKNLRITPRQLDILSVLGSRLFEEETLRTGEGEYSTYREIKVTGTRTITEEHIMAAVKAVKSNSERVVPEDVANRVLNRIVEMRGINRENDTYQNALTLLSAAIGKYWNAPDKPSPKKRK